MTRVRGRGDGGPVRWVLAVAAGLLLAGSAAGPAVAADEASPDDEYYLSRVTEIRPTVPGLDVRIGADDRITLTNRGEQSVVVLGYAGEDYLRIGPTGVEENTASPSSALNEGKGLDRPPPDASATSGRAPAHWVKRSDQPSYTWRDNRVLWTNDQRPPIVLEDPHGQHSVFAWALQLRAGTTPVLVLGEVRWTGVPWLGTGQLAALVMFLVLVLAAVGFVLLRRTRNRQPPNRQPPNRQPPNPIIDRERHLA